MSGPVVRWAPGSILSLGVVLIVGLGPQRSLELREPLQDAVPASLMGKTGENVTVPPDEAQVAGFDDYLFRSYGVGDDGFSVYVGYYASQSKGHTIHSPKNCLPGAGWEALSSRPQAITTANGRTVTVNRYLLQRGDARALVLYWYQGRGRVEYDEYKVKWDLLVDSSLHQRSDEALVRVVVPIQDGEDAAAESATTIAATLVPAVDKALPGA